MPNSGNTSKVFEKTTTQKQEIEKKYTNQNNFNHSSELLLSILENDYKGDLDLLFTDVDDIFEDFKCKRRRFSYSTITAKIFQTDNQAIIDKYISSSLMLIELYDVRDDMAKLVIAQKLNDHITLANYQKNNVNLKSNELEQNLRDRIDKLNESNKELTSRLNNINSELISLLAIFTAISFIVFGGITSFEGIFIRVFKDDFEKVMIIASLWSIGIFDIVYFLLHYISKITHLPLSKDSSSVHFMNRHKTVIAINALFITIIILSLLYSLLKTFPPLSEFVGTLTGLVIITVSVLVLLVFMWYFILKKRYEPSSIDAQLARLIRNRYFHLKKKD